MKKITISILIFILSLFSLVQASETDLKGYINDMKAFETNLFPEINEDGFIDSLLTGDIKLDGENVINRILEVFIKEIKSSMQLMFKIIAVCILCGIIKNMQSSNNSGVSETLFYVCYLMIVILIITSFMNIVELCQDTVKTLNSFMGIFVPIIIIYLTISGHFVVTKMLQPILLGMTTLISNLVSFVLIPVVLISTILTLVTNISEEVDVSKIGGLLKKTALFVLELLLIIFVGLLSLEGSLAANVDGIVAKTTKSVVSTTIPVVGKLIGDATDSVIGATAITKNAIGFVGVLIIVSICCVPLIKSLIILMVFNLSLAIAEPLVDKRISKCLSGICDSTRIMVGILAAMSVLFIISVTFLIKMSNFSLMYR